MQDLIQASITLAVLKYLSLISTGLQDLQRPTYYYYSIFLQLGQQTPFRLTVKTDAQEVIADTAQTAINSENIERPSGLQGFSITYAQNMC